MAKIPVEVTELRQKLGIAKVRESDQMPIGDFILELNNLRISLLFQS